MTYNHKVEYHSSFFNLSMNYSPLLTVVIKLIIKALKRLKGGGSEYE